MNITPDNFIVWQNGFFKINDTILFTWILMAVIISVSVILRLMLTKEKNIGRLQSFFEVLIYGIKEQVEKMGKVDINFVFPFIATIFIFILFSNLMQIIPFFYSPTASLSTNVALVIVVVSLGVIYGIKQVGVFGYFKKYLRPTPVMLVMNIISDVSSNCALAIRLYGNVMSGMIISAVISQVAFLAIGFPIFLSMLSFISSVIQAYIFSVLALVFIISAEN